jgi:predicted deacylase
MEADHRKVKRAPDKRSSGLDPADAGAHCSAMLRIELEPLDLAPYRRGGQGVDYVHRIDSGRPGPTVMLNALTHGNELCGAHALHWLFEREVRPTRGSLILSFANVAAYARFDPARPGASRFVDEDFNRIWSPEKLAEPERNVERRRAVELLPFVAEADCLLDLHSMQQDNAPLLLTGLLPRGIALARAMGRPAHVVADRGHAGGVRMRDYGGFSRADSTQTAVLVECGQHWRRASAEVAIDASLACLRACGAVVAAFAADRPTPASPQRVIEVTEAVTVASDRFAFARPWRGLEVIEKAGTPIAEDDGRPVLTPYDHCVLVMPAPRLRRGQTAVRLGRYHA